MQAIILLMPVFFLLFPSLCTAMEKADRLVVYKSEYKMVLISQEKIIREYRVVFGANPKGHKQRQGDERTPEGRYILDYKKRNSKFYKAIHISYPNATDKKRARAQGVNPGGAIMIHGQPNGYGWLSLISRYFNWTDGCIAVTNRDMDEIWEAVDAGTPILILP